MWLPSVNSCRIPDVRDDHSHHASAQQHSRKKKAPPLPNLCAKPCNELICNHKILLAPGRRIFSIATSRNPIRLTAGMIVPVNITICMAGTSPPAILASGQRAKPSEDQASADAKLMTQQRLMYIHGIRLTCCKNLRSSLMINSCWPVRILTICWCDASRSALRGKIDLACARRARGGGRIVDPGPCG